MPSQATRRKVVFLSFIMFLLTLSGSANLFATNGAQLTGFTAINESLGGSGVAYPQDTSTILVNPAGLTELPRMVHFNLLLGFPTTRINTSAAPAGNTAAGTVTSDEDGVVLPGAAFNIPVDWLGEGRLSIGAGIIPIAGFAVDYPASRVNSAFTNNEYDNHTFYGVLKILTGAGYKINDQLSVGGALHVNRAQLESNAATATVDFAQTAGRDRTDGSFGIGFGLGVLYKPFDFLSVGVNYTSEQWMDDFERYGDILADGINLPQQMTAGLSFVPPFVPDDKLLINTDYRWINWSSAGGGFGQPNPAGFGWRDQHVAMIGAQYGLFDFLILRAGYNYAKSAVPAGAIFVSILGPVIAEHHLSGGLGFNLSEKVDLDFSYVRTFQNTVTDDGSFVFGGAPIGQGAFAQQSVHQVSSQINLKF